jgi:peptidoglycan-N-acetylglucosamine deacetylase
MRHCLAKLPACLLFVAALMTSSPTSADRGALQRACFPANALAAKTSEIKPAKGIAGSQAEPPIAVALSPATPLPANLRGAIRRVDLPPGRKLVALTLDLCEQPGEVAGYDGPIIDYLRATGTRATLFAGGKWLMTHGERAQQLIADPLFEIGGHGWAHRNMRLLTGAALSDELLHTERAYRQRRGDLAQRSCATGQSAAAAALPARMGLQRFPFGACNAGSLQAAADNGLLSIQWDVSTGDPWPGQSARAIADAMIRNVRPGSIIIAHANGRGHHTAEALPLAIPKLRAMGYEFVTVGELLAAGRPVISATCYDSRPGDTDKYDFLFSKRPQPASTTGANSNGWRPSTDTAAPIPR